MLKYSNKKVIEMQDWDSLVQETYGKPYCFQQQNGCQERQMFNIIIPNDDSVDDEMYDNIPEIINGTERGVKFETWLNTEPETHAVNNNWNEWRVNMFWERNFYPDIYTIANDLLKQGLIEPGNYYINIDW